jgi:hypothetical protein
MKLEEPLPLEEILDQVQEDSLLRDDFTDIALGETRMEETGEWRFGENRGRFTRHSLAQICAYLKLPGGGTVPSRYLARCPNALAAKNLNHWLETLELPEKVFVRTHKEGSSCPCVIRAILSDTYAAVNNEDVLETLLELIPNQRLGVQSWSLDDEQMTLRLILDSDHPASLDDPLRVGLHVSNSEVGLKKVSISSLITRLVCSNGLVVNVGDLGGVHRRHVGRAQESLYGFVHDGLTKVLLEADQAAYRLVQLREKPAPEPVEAFIEKTAKEMELPEGIAEKAIEALEGETIYDVINGFTLCAQDLPVAERLLVETAMSKFLRD